MKRLPFLLAVLLVPIRAHAVGMIISPVQLGLYGAAGSTVSGVINVSSSRPQENNIHVSFGDYLIQEDGKRTDVTVPGTPPARSCRAWLDADQYQFVSPEQGKVPVVISARVPANASGSYWAEVYFESITAPPSFKPGAQAPVVGVRVVPRIGIAIIVTVKGTEKYSLKIDSLEATRTAGGIDAVVRVENCGNAVAMVSGALAVEKPAAGKGAPEELVSKDIDPATSYPGIRRNIKITLPLKTFDPASTDLHAYLRFGPGPDRALAASANLQALLRAAKNENIARRR